MKFFFVIFKMNYYQFLTVHHCINELRQARKGCRGKNHCSLELHFSTLFTTTPPLPCQARVIRSLRLRNFFGFSPTRKVNWKTFQPFAQLSCKAKHFRFGDLPIKIICQRRIAAGVQMNPIWGNLLSNFVTELSFFEGRTKSKTDSEI